MDLTAPAFALSEPDVMIFVARRKGCPGAARRCVNPPRATHTRPFPNDETAGTKCPPRETERAGRCPDLAIKARGGGQRRFGRTKLQIVSKSDPSKPRDVPGCHF